MMFENIPAEMRGFQAWVLWRYEETDSGRPTKVPYSITGYPASPTNNESWTTYDKAVACYLLHPDKYAGIGFVLSDDDPYTFIDLDKPKNPDGTALDPAEYDKRMARQYAIYEAFESYAELSPSGEGLHIIVKGSVPNGRKRSSVEVYSNQRFMTMTGNVQRNVPIKEYNEWINSLWAEMGKGQAAVEAYAGLEQALCSDDEVMRMASTASNAEKFNDLYFNGNWQKYYPSQSEADFALVDIIAFYSKNRMQVRKLFLLSKLAEREKSRASYRIAYMLNRCFDNMLPPVDFEGLRNQVQAAIEKARQPAPSKQPIEINEEKEYLNLAPPALLQNNPDFIYNPPKGLLGDIAKYIYAQSTRPVPEIALAGAIGLMSGICGKCFNISGTGLNQYTLLLASTGTGKEAAQSGISKLMSRITSTAPTAAEFIGPSEISSQQALVKALSASPSMISIVGEFGLYLKQMGSDNANPHMAGLKSLLLKLYNVSGNGDKLGAMAYSQKENNVSALSAPAFSLFGESAPEPFYESLTESMLSGGLLPRFTVIEYHGDRVPRNRGASSVIPSEELIRSLSTLCASAAGLNHQHKITHVQMTPEAEQLFDALDLFCDKQIVGSMELKKQIWTRVHLKVLRLAALVAVGINPFEPRIDLDTANWAKAIIITDAKNMLGRFEDGDVGLNNGEQKQLNVVCGAVKKYLTANWSEVEKMSGGEKAKPLHAEKIVPYSFLQRSTASNAAFKNDKMGATNALKRTIKTLIDRGDLQLMMRADLMKRFGTGAEAYAIGSPGAFGL